MLSDCIMLLCILFQDHPMAEAESVEIIVFLMELSKRISFKHQVMQITEVSAVLFYVM